ncbi:MAG: hypothetical protein ABI193_03980 [Minicystis sp.]
MRLSLSSLSFVGMLAFLGLSACAPPPAGAQVASAASQPGYAQGYPQALGAAMDSFNATQTEVKKTLGEVDEYPNKLKDPGWARVREILGDAHEAGKSQGYVERMRRVEGASQFFAAEKDEIVRKVSWAAQATAKKTCDVEVSGAVGASLKDVIDKQLEKEVREANEAHRLIERYRVQLGKENAAALEKQADAISRASFLAHVQIVEDEVAIRRLVGEAGEVKKTGERFLEEERRFQADKRTTAPEKKASEARVAEMTKSREQVDAAAKQGEALLPKLEEQAQALERSYEDKMSAFLAKLDEKAKAEPH